MEEKILKQSEGMYFKSMSTALNGFLILTNKRVTYSGVRQQLQLSHGVVGNMIKDKLEQAMGIDPDAEQLIFDIPLSEVKCGLKRFGFQKRVVLTDGNGSEFKVLLNSKAERDEWPEAVEQARKQV